MGIFIVVTSNDNSEFGMRNAELIVVNHDEQQNVSFFTRHEVGNQFAHILNSAFRIPHSEFIFNS